MRVVAPAFFSDLIGFDLDWIDDAVPVFGFFWVGRQIRRPSSISFFFFFLLRWFGLFFFLSCSLSFSASPFFAGRAVPMARRVHPLLPR